MSDTRQPVWFKSSYSGAPNNECVECATNVPDQVLVRDSKRTSGPVLGYPRATWSDFIEAVRHDSLAPRT